MLLFYSHLPLFSIVVPKRDYVSRIFTSSVADPGFPDGMNFQKSLSDCDYSILLSIVRDFVLRYSTLLISRRQQCKIIIT